MGFGIKGRFSRVRKRNVSRSTPHSHTFYSIHPLIPYSVYFSPCLPISCPFGPSDFPHTRSQLSHCWASAFAETRTRSRLLFINSSNVSIFQSGSKLLIHFIPESLLLRFTPCVNTKHKYVTILHTCASHMNNDRFSNTNRLHYIIHFYSNGIIHPKIFPFMLNEKTFNWLYLY